MMLTGLAGPLVMPPVMALLLHAVPASRAGVASGVFNTSRQTGGALAVAVFGALLASWADFLHGLQVSTWNRRELDAIGSAGELRISTRRPDGTLRPAVPIWVVRVGDDLYVRSYRGRGGAWFRHASTQGAAHINAAAIDCDVAVTVPAQEARAAINEAYRVKYARYGGTYTEAMTAGSAADATLRLAPAGETAEKTLNQ